MRIAISGSSGLIGSALARDLIAAGDQVIPIRRTALGTDPAGIAWNLARQEIERDKFEGVDVVVHLAGESVAARRWSAEQKQRIRSSRVDSTRLIADTLASLSRKPKLLIVASAIGIYGDRGEESLSEESPIGTGFLAQVGKEWEASAASARAAGIRVVHIRTGIVLSAAGGAIAKMLLPFKLGLGGKLGSGKQWMSWIALEDLIAALKFLIQRADLQGAFNLTSPAPVTNSEFTRTLGKVLHRPTIFPVPAFVLKMVLGEMAKELLLSSTKVFPKKLLEAGFKFKFESLEQALVASMQGQ